MEKNESDVKKLGLFLAGGGARGSFQIGALKHLIGDLKRDYSVVAGFSVGALSGAMVAQGDFLDLYDIWQGLGSVTDVLGGNLRFYKGLLSMSPLRKIIEQKLDLVKLRGSKTDFFFTAVDLQLGEVVELNKFSEPLVDWLLASSSIPGVFPPVEIDGRQFVDGGVLTMKPLAPLIRGGAEEIDIVLCTPLSQWFTAQRFETIFETTIRSIELAQSEMLAADIGTCRMINDEVEKWKDVREEANFIENFVLWRVERKKKFPLGTLKKIKLNIIEPPADIIGVLDFSKDKIKKAIDEGYKKAVDLSLKGHDI